MKKFFNIIVILFLFVSCNGKTRFYIDYALLENEYENFGDELIEKYYDNLKIGNDYTIKFYKEKFALTNEEIRLLGEWDKATSYYGDEPDYIISKLREKVKNDVRSISFYANRVFVLQFYWDTYIFGSWNINEDNQLTINIKYLIEKKEDEHLYVENIENKKNIVIVSNIKFVDYYIFIDGFDFIDFPKELYSRFNIREDYPRVKHSFYWPGENQFDPESNGGKILYNFEWNETSVINMFRYFIQ